MKRLFSKTKSMLCYLGMTPEEYRSIEDNAAMENRRELIGFSSIMVIISCFLSIAAYYVPSMRNGVAAYLAMGFLHGFVLASLWTTGKSGKIWINIGMQFFTATLYGIAMYVGIYADPNSLAVMFTALLTIVPLLFNRKPIYVILEQIAAMVLFVCLGFGVKEPTIFAEDFVDIIGFAIAGAVLTTITMRTKFHYHLVFQQNQDNYSRMEESLEAEKLVIEERDIALGKANERLNIIKSLTSSFCGVYYIDLQEFTFEELDVSLPEMGLLIGKNGDALDRVDILCTYMVAPQYADKMRDFANLHTLNERLHYKDKISIQFIGNHIGWAEGAFYAGDRDENGLCKHVLWTVRSINDQKDENLRQEKKLLDEKYKAEMSIKNRATFMFNLSHELRSSIINIIDFAKLADKEGSMAAKEKYLNLVKSSGFKLLGQVEDILELSRIDNGTVYLDEYPSEPKELYEEELSFLKNRYIPTYIRVESVISETMKPIYVDVKKIKRIIEAIVENSVRYTDKDGTIMFSIDQLPHSANGYCTMRCIISDTGCGMSESFLPQACDAFSQENRFEKGSRGSGLGLALVKGLVSGMGGTVSIVSQKGEGTSTTIMIPHRLASDNAVQIAKKSKSAILDETSDFEMTADEFSGRRILVAEDNNLNAIVVEEILREAGFIIERAEDGVLCVSMVEKADPGYYSLILMDIQMPNMDGYQAIKTIRGLEDFEKARTPIIAMSIDINQEIRDKAFESGANCFLPKPVDLRKLLHLMRDIIDVNS